MNANTLFKISLVVLILVCLLSNATGQRDSGQDESLDIEFIHSMDLFELEMELQILEIMSRRYFYIRPERLDTLQKKKRELGEELGSTTENEIEALDKWKEEAAKVREAEKSAMLELAEQYGRRIIKAAAGDEEERPEFLKAVDEWEENVRQWKLDRTKHALSIARYVEGEAKKYSQDSELTKWNISAKNIYRGSIKQTDSLVKRIVDLDRDRLEDEVSRITALEAINHFETAEEIYADPLGYAQGKIKERVQEKFNEYIKESFPDLDPENLEESLRNYVQDQVPGIDLDVAEETWDKAAGIFDKVQEVRSKLDELDNDPALNTYPEALQLAKNFAVLHSLYTHTLGMLQESAMAEPLGPFLDVLSFYGDAIGLVPTIAQKLGKCMTTFEQTEVQSKGAWKAVYEQVDVDVLSKTDLFQHYQIPIAMNATVEEGSSRFFMPVEGRVHVLNKEQFVRMACAISDERIVHALTHAREDGLLSTDADHANNSSWQSMARETPFDKEQLLALAVGDAVKVDGKQWTAESLSARADTMLSLATGEMAVRVAVERFESGDDDRRREFMNIVQQYGIPIQPSHLLSRLRFHIDTGNAAVLERYLKRARLARARERLGVPTLGIPIVKCPPDDRVERGEEALLEVHVITAGLKQDRAVSGRVSLQVPSWVSVKQAPDQVTLKNGLTKLECRLEIPKKTEANDFEVIVKIVIPPGPYEDKPVAAEGIGYFSLTVLEQGPLGLTCRRRPGTSAGNELKLTSETLPSVDKKEQDYSLEYEVEHATDKNGPWTTETPLRALIRPNQSINVSNGPRTGEDSLRFEHRPQERVFAPNSKRKPFYYRARQQWMKNGTVDSSSEAFYSNITTPKEAFIRILDLEGKEPRVVEDEGYRSFGRGAPNLKKMWTTFGAVLSLSDQDYDFPGAHFVVQFKDWQGHFWAARYEGDRVCRMDQTKYGGPSAVLKVPFSLEGGTVTVTAEYGRYRATTKFKVAAGAGVRERAEKARGKLQEERDNFPRSIQVSRNISGGLDKRVIDARRRA